MNTKLGGCLVGYGLKKKDGTFKKVIFAKPIHNTITKHCLNNLLTFDGTNAAAPIINSDNNRAANWGSLFVKASDIQATRYGVFNSCALGDGTGETSVNDTELKHRVTNATPTKKTGSNWCLTTFENNSAQIKLRVSHTHTIDTDFTIKEIGWYNQTWSELSYTLSSRVQLDEFIDVENGDEFYSIYEITVSFQGVEKFNDLAGLGGGLKTNAIYNNSDFISFPLISSSGNGYVRKSATNNYFTSILLDRAMTCPIPWFMDSLAGAVCVVKTNLPKLTPFLTNSIYQFGSYSYSRTLKDYTPDSFYRDTELLVNPSATTGNIYAIEAMGTIYRFGTFDENDVFTPAPVTIDGALRLTVRQSWSTDLLTPAG